MENENIALQAKVYLYHLNNSTKENSFRPTEIWKFSQVSEDEKLAIEHDYYPTVSTRVSPEIMQAFSDSVMFHLKENHLDIAVPDKIVAQNKESTHFIAYSPTRMHR